MDLEKFLRENVKPATGCTEPVAVSYATSVAYNSLFENFPEKEGYSPPEPDSDSLNEIRIRVDRDVYKNAKSITIPRTCGRKGVKIAAAMGMYLDFEKELDILRDVDEEVLQKAEKLIEEGKVKIEEVKDKSDLDIGVDFEYECGDEIRNSTTRIEKLHDHISSVTVDGKEVYQDSLELRKAENKNLPDSLGEIVEIVQNMDDDIVEEVYKGIEMNMEMAEEGLNGDYGMKIGKKFKKLMENGDEYMNEDLVTKVKVKSAAAGDARMGGAHKPVMSTSGSGNQGITALVPIGVIGQENDIDKEKQAEGGMLAHLVTKYSTDQSGYLSAMCGCAIKAGMGAAAGITYTLGGDVDDINSSIKNTAANITGMICDGTKEGCALKLSTAAATATESSLLALEGVEVPSDNGIIDKKAENTMKNVGRISDKMVETDLEIVDIMRGE